MADEEQRQLERALALSIQAEIDRNISSREQNSYDVIDVDALLDDQRRSGAADPIDEMDADLMRAIELSRMESSRPRREQVNGDEDEEMTRALEASLRPETPRDDDATDSEAEEEFHKNIEKAIKESKLDNANNRPASTGSSTLIKTEIEPALASAQMLLSESAPSTSAASLPPQSRTPVSANEQAPSSSISSLLPLPIVEQAVPAPMAALNGLAGIDRQAMERERQERLKRRLAAECGDSDSDSISTTSKRPKIFPSNVGSAGIAGLNRMRTIGDLDREEAEQGQQQRSGQTLNGKGKEKDALEEKKNLEKIRYWDGEMRMTSNSLIPKEKEGKVFSFKDVVGPPSTISQAVIATYAIEPEWLCTFFTQKTSVILIGHPHNKEIRNQSRFEDVLPGWWSRYPEFSSERGTMHMKFLLLFHKNREGNDDYLRICITSGNFVSYDWDQIENMVFIQDFPLGLGAFGVGSEPQNDFEIQWRSILTALGVQKTLKLASGASSVPLPFTSLADFSKWDLSKARIKIVASYAGVHEGWNAINKVGHTRLADVIREEGWSPPEGFVVNVEGQSSSLGNYTFSWMKEFYNSCFGRDPRTWLGKGTPMSSNNGPWPPVKVLFPSLRTVDESKLGRPGGGTMFCQGEMFALEKRPLFYDSVSKRGPVLQHVKMFIATFVRGSDPTASSSKLFFPSSSTASHKKTSNSPYAQAIDKSETDAEDDGKEIGIPMEKKLKAGGWIYTGSANFSGAAWGRLSLPKKAGSVPKITITNYELGFIFPLGSDPDTEATQIASWVRPPRKYRDSDKPWMQFVDGDNGPGRY